MATITETLQNLAQDLRDAIAFLRGLRSDMQAIADSAASRATTIINNYAQRSPTRILFVDPTDGLDTNAGTFAAPFRTIDKAVEARYTDGFTEIYCFGDITLGTYTNVYNGLTFIGATKNTGDVTIPYKVAQRKFAFAAEAKNSPFGAFGRTVAGLQMVSGDLTFVSLDITLADPIAAVGFVFHVLTAGQVRARNCTINAPTADARGRLLLAPDASRAQLWFLGSLGSNAAGKVFAGVAAGANPNSDTRYASNLTAA